MHAKKSKNRTIIKNQSSLPDLRNGWGVLFSRCRSSISHQLFLSMDFKLHLNFSTKKSYFDFLGNLW